MEEKKGMKRRRKRRKRRRMKRRNRRTRRRMKRRRKTICFTRMNIQFVESTIDFSFQYSMKKASCHLREKREKKG